MPLRRLINAARGRFLLYMLAFPSAVALDVVTPLGVADWLIEIVLVWIASVWGGITEMKVVAALGSVTMIAGLWSSPAAAVPFWVGASNRLVAIGVMWTVVNTAIRRRIAEAEKEKAKIQIRRLQGLLPICAACKAIRDRDGEWRGLESYLSDHSEVRLSHGLCPSCESKYMTELLSDEPNL